MQTHSPNERLPRPTRRRLWTILWMTVVFACGMVIGGGLTLKIAYDRFQESFHHPAIFAERINHRLDRYLDLSPDQRRQVAQIIKRDLDQLHALRTKMRQQLLAQLEKTRQDLNAVLTPEQTQRLNRRFDRLQRIWLPPVDE